MLVFSVTSPHVSHLISIEKVTTLKILGILGSACQEMGTKITYVSHQCSSYRLRILEMIFHIIDKPKKIVNPCNLVLVFCSSKVTLDGSFVLILSNLTFLICHAICKCEMF